MRATVVRACVVALVLLPACGDDSDSSTDTTTSSLSPTTTTSTTITSTTTTSPTTTTTISTTDRAFVVWPFPDSDLRFDDPIDAATSFAVDLVGFVDPVVGEFREGDSRSGEIEVRSSATGPATTVLVRRLGADDSWWVLGSIATNIEVTDPIPQTAIDDPLQMAGRSRAFEGTVEVDVVADGSTERIGSGFVTGGSGPDFGPFSGSLRFTSPQGGWGSVIFFTRSMEDGQIWEATTVRVGFIGGD
jgi:hypothetical protein